MSTPRVPPDRNCHVCPTPLHFAPDAATGAMQVLDLKAPVYELLPDGTCARVRGKVYVSHWSTCPHRDRIKAAQTGARGGK
jgi:hypothetical protein